MSFSSVAEFLHMGGHGLYVWLSYGITFAVIFANVWWVRAKHRAILRQAAGRMQRNATEVES